MKYIISGTNRAGSNTLKVCKIIQSIYQSQGEKVEIIDLNQVALHDLNGNLYGQALPPHLAEVIEKINKADGLHVVIPEYNGSMPGALKYFIDFWKYPDSFEHRPVAFVGIGGMFGGLRPVEHLQQVFGYRNSFIYPDRIFMQNVWRTIKDDKIEDAVVNELLLKQVVGFQKFCLALNEVGLHANQKTKN